MSSRIANRGLIDEIENLGFDYEDVIWMIKDKSLNLDDFSRFKDQDCIFYLNSWGFVIIALICFSY